MKKTKTNSHAQLEPLCRNLLVLRESYNVLYSQITGMDTFYKALGCNTDELTNCVTRYTLSDKIHNKISDNLHFYGMEKRALLNEDALEFELSNDMVDAMDDYFDECSDKTKKEKALRTLRAFILKAYSENDKYMAGVFTICYNIASQNLDDIEKDLAKAYDILDELDKTDFSKLNIKSRQFAKFINKLAETVNSVEKEFPEFYAVAQQMKEDKSAQSIMNEICNNLNSLKSAHLTIADVESDSCTNMMLRITELMQDIQNTILSAQQDAQEQAQLAVELLNKN